MYRWRCSMKKIPRVAYTLEFELEALRRVRSGEAVRAVAREIGVPEQTIRNWFKAQVDGKLGTAANGKPITPVVRNNRIRDSALGLRDSGWRVHGCPWHD